MSGQITILMAACDGHTTIARAAASVLAQRHTDWELIVIADDGADYTPTLANAGIDDPRIRFTATGAPRSGPGAARNIGAGIARGDFICALDADDYWEPGKLTALLPLAAECGLAADNIRVVDETGAEIGAACLPDGPPLALDGPGLVATPTPLFPLFRRDVFGRGYFPDLRFAEDVVLNLEAMARAGGTLTVLRDRLTVYVQGAASMCNAPGSAARFDAAYEEIMAAIADGRIETGAMDRAAIIAAFEEKRARNRAYGDHIATGGTLSFQAFAAGKDGAT